jgi:ppGpp synthetase/RelA/SpoT-type nucleotidyltranferase
VKSLPSVFEKIVRKGYPPKLFSCTDVVGIRVMCLYPSHIDRIVGLLRAEFTVLEVVDKRPQSDPERFGYNSVHLLCKIASTNRAALPEYRNFADVIFEVQVRTILQEAWAEIQHRLVYKSKVATPNEVKRIIALLSAHLESADMHFQDIYEKREAYVEKLRNVEASSLEDEPLNIDSVLETLRRQYPWAEGWEKVVGDELVPALTRLLAELSMVGITTVKQLISFVQKWTLQTTEWSKETYAEAVPKRKSADPFARFYDWQDKTGQFYTPMGHVMTALKKEFPQSRSDAAAKRLAEKKALIE